MLAAIGGAPLVAAAPAFAGADPPRYGHIPDDLKPGGGLDRFVAELAARDEFSGTLQLTYRDRPILKRSYGMANKEQGLPNGPDTLFSLASVTKLFTAVAIAQLVQRRRVAHHEKLGAYLSGFPAEIADKVTVHHLLTHTSGMGDHHQVPGYREAARTWTSASQVLDGTMAFIRQMPLAFAPGTGSKYSNAGFHTLGAIVAAASGQSYHDYIREHIFRPAGMRTTDFYTRPQRYDDRRIARPYQKQPSGERVDVLDQKLFIGTPAGDAQSTCADMDRFAQALLGERLLNHALTEITLSGKVPVQPEQPGQAPPGATPPLASFQCYGPMGAYFSNQRSLGHGGGSQGVSTTIDMFPDSHWTVVILSNYDARTVRPIAGMARRLIIGEA